MTVDDFIYKSLTRAIGIRNPELGNQHLNPEYSAIYFCFDNDAIKLTALPDTDEIEVQFIDSYLNEEVEGKSILESFIGKKLTYTWRCENTNNYFDVFLLSFTHLKPNVMVLSEGSCLKLFDITPAAQ